jgi:tetratricopeptide (TPR) repeat protein
MTLRLSAVVLGLAVALAGAGQASAQTKSESNSPKNIQTFSLSDQGGSSAQTASELLKAQKTDSKGKPLGVETISVRPEAMAEEKLEASIAALNELIEMTDDDDPSKPEYLARLAETYWDKAENFFNKAYGDEIFKRLRAAQEAGNEALVEAVQADQRSLMEQRSFWQQESANVYRRVVDSYPEYPAIDETLYYLGFALVQMGMQAEAFPYFARVVREAPNSQFVPDALLNIGEFYFNSGRMDEAEKMYSEVENFKESTAYGLAIYKKGWCFYNLARHEEAMNQFLVVIDFAKSPEAAKIGYGKQLLKEAQRDLVMVYSQVGSPDSAIKVFKAISPDGYMDLAIKLAEGYASQGEYVKSSRLFKNIMAEYGSRDDSWRVIEFQRAILENSYKSGVKKSVVEEARRLIGLLDKFGASAPKVFLDPEMANAEELIRVVATTYHKEARVTKEEVTLEFTHHLYNEYLRLFPNSQFVYEITINYAYLLQDIGKDDLAAERFSQVVKMKPDGALALDAAHAAVSSYYKLVENQDNKAKSEDTSDTAPMEIPEFQQKLIAACDTYLKMAPRDAADVVEAQLARSLAYYQYNHFNEAARGFGDIIENNPDHVNAPDAARLLLSSLVLMRDIPGLNVAAGAISSRPQLMKGDVPGIVKKINEQKDFNACYEFEQKALYTRSAECFLKYVANFPDTPLKDRSLINAANNFFKARLVEQSLKANEQLVNEFPDSPLAARAVYNIADTYRRLAVYSEAARFYETFVELYPKHELTEEGLRFATMLRSGLGDYNEAVTDLKKYMKLFPKSEHIAGVAIEIATIYAKQGKPLIAIKEFQDYLKKYGESGGPDRRLQAHLKIAQLYDAMPGTKNKPFANEWFDKTISVYDAMPDDVKLKVTALGLTAVAEAMFVKGEAVLGKMREVTLKGNMKIVTDQIAQKLALAEEAMKIFNSVEAFGQPNWTIAAFSRKGFGFQELAETIENAPAPANLTLDQKQFYREGLSQKALPIWDKAKDSYRQCVQLAQELKWYNRYSEEAEEALMKLDPEFRSLPDIRPRPSYYAVNRGKVSLLSEKEGVDAPKWSDAAVEDRIIKAAAAPDATAEALYNKGAWLKTQGKNAEARTWFDKALAKNPRLGEAQASIGVLLNDEGKTSEAETYFKRALEVDPANAIANNYYAARALASRDFTGAINLARIGLVSDPDSRDAYAVLAAAYLEMGLIDAGMLVARNALSLDAADGQIETILGMMYLKRDEVRQAVKMFAKAVVDAPGLFEAWMDLGLVTLSYKDFKSSEEAFRKAVELQPTSRDARISLAIAYRGANRGQEALAILKALAAGPRDPDVHFNMCLLYQENMSAEDKALVECQTFLSMIPKDHSKRKEVERRIEGIEATISALKETGTTGSRPPVEPVPAN